jgi:hypothetical protein
MMSQLLTHASLLGQLPADVEEQVKDILDRILRLAGYNANSNTGSNPVGGTMTANFLPISYQQTNFVFPARIIMKSISVQIPTTARKAKPTRTIRVA